MQQRLLNIIVIGPESTGKSSLSAALAAHFNCLWCPEFARAYLLKEGTQYNYDDLLTIAKGQWQLWKDYQQKAIVRGDQLLMVDTDMYVMKVWCEYVFGKCHQWILDRINEQEVDGYLLCDTDLPWVKDELREYPDLETRQTLFHLYKDILLNQSAPWALVSGQANERTQSAIHQVENWLKQIKF